MHHCPTESFVVKVGQQHSFTSKTDEEEQLKGRLYKKQRTSTSALVISTACFEMFHRDSSERQESQSPRNELGIAPNAEQHSATTFSIYQPLHHALEPIPFRAGTALELSTDPESNKADGSSSQRPFAIVSQNVAHGISSLNQDSQQDQEGMQTSWMATVDRILGNRSQNIAQAPNGPSSLMDSSQNASESRGNKRRRNDEQVAIDEPEDETSQRAKARFRPYQRDQWDQQYTELLKFRQEHGHCHVPHTYPANNELARWCKRQRYQYKRKLENKQSAMSDTRQQKLDNVGFVWDLQTMVWQERFHELVEYKTKHGHCNVPCRYEENPSLGMWVKCQRRQYRLFQSGSASRLTPERFQQLANLGFTSDHQADESSMSSNRT